MRHTSSTCSKIITHVRQFLDARAPGSGDADAEPDMAGGAAAMPFQTWHNGLDMQMVGGLVSVYEVGLT